MRLTRDWPGRPKKSINGLINKVNSPNIAVIVREILLQKNIVRGRGLLCQSIIQAQTASPHPRARRPWQPSSTPWSQYRGKYSLLKRLIQLQRGIKRNDKTRCSQRPVYRFIGQSAGGTRSSLEIVLLLLENPIDDSAEGGHHLPKEVGQKLSEVSPGGHSCHLERLDTFCREHPGQEDPVI